MDVARRAREDLERQAAVRSTEALRLAETARRAEEEERKQEVLPKQGVPGGAIFNEITSFIASKMPSVSRIGLEGGRVQTGGRVPVEDIRVLLQRLRPNITTSFDRDTLYDIHFPNYKPAEPTDFRWVKPPATSIKDVATDININITRNTDTGDFTKESHTIKPKVGGAILTYMFKFTVVKAKPRFVSSGSPKPGPSVLKAQVDRTRILAERAKKERSAAVRRRDSVAFPMDTPLTRGLRESAEKSRAPPRQDLPFSSTTTPQGVARAATNQRAEGMAAPVRPRVRPPRGGTRKNGRRMTRRRKNGKK